MPSSLRLLLWGALGVAGGFAACVGGDDNIVVDGGNDATVDQSVNDQSNDQQSSDASTCGVCDGSCYDDVCNGATVVTTGMGWYFGCALLADGTVWCWGQNEYGQIKDPPTAQLLPPTQIVGVSNVMGIALGAFHACAVEADSSLWCWGINDYGELGHPSAQDGDLACFNNTPCNPVPSKVAGIPAKQTNAGRWDTCAVTTTGGVSCWGFNGSGQLGQGGAPSDGTSTPTAIPTLSGIEQIRTSRFTGDNVCAIDNKGALWCWGNNDFGQLGNGAKTGNETTCYEPTGPTTNTCNTTPTKVATPANVVDVAVSTSTCAALVDGTVWCWGDARGGEMGNGAFDAGAQLTPTQVVNVAGATNIEGNQTMCARLDAGAISCWGVARWGVPGGFGVDAGCLDQAGNATTCQLTPVILPNVTSTGFPRVDLHSAIVNTPTGLLAWGANDELQLGHPHSAGDDENENNSTPSPVQGLP